MSDLHNFNAGRKSWKMYTKELTSKDGDDLTITPYEGEDLILEVSGNGNILFKEDGITYNLADLSNAASSNVNLTNYDDASFGNVEISGNLDISNGVINFFASDEQLLGPDTGIAQKVQDLSNNLLISNNDASFNNVQINGTLNLPDSSNNGYGVSGEVLISRAANSTPIWGYPALHHASFALTSNKTFTSPNTVELIDELFTTLVTSGDITNNNNGTFTINTTGAYLINCSFFVQRTPTVIMNLFLYLKKDPLGVAANRTILVESTTNALNTGFTQQEIDYSYLNTFNATDIIRLEGKCNQNYIAIGLNGSTARTYINFIRIA